MVILKEIVYDETYPNEIINLINFNFDQLLMNGYGPTGDIGTSGNSGVVGVQGSVGATGNTGSQGTTGSAGPAGLESWVADGSTVNNTNILKPIQLQSYPNLPNVIIGSDLINNRSQLSVSRNLQNMSSNIRLTTSTNNKYFDMSLDNGSMLMSFDALSTSSKIALQSDIITLHDSIDSDVFAIFSNILVDFKKPTIIDKTVTLLAGAKLNLNDPTAIPAILPQQNDVIIAVDETGKLGWSDTTSLNTNVSQGTVVPILPSEINSNNFDMSSNSNTANTTGRGIAGGLYSGWYVCHGYTWSKNDSYAGNGDGKAYKTPRFNYDFGGKTNNTDQIKIQIKEGSNYTVTVATPTQSTAYNVGFTAYIKSMFVGFRVKFDQSHTELENESDHQNVVISNQTHIVFLGRTDLTWSFVEAIGFTNKTLIYFLDAPKDANSIIFMWSPFYLGTRIKRQFTNNDLNAINKNPNNNIAERNFPSLMHSGNMRQEFIVLQDSPASNWVDVTKPIYEKDGLLARKGWYGSQPYATMPTGKFRDFAYWDGKEWYFTGPNY